MRTFRPLVTTALAAGLLGAAAFGLSACGGSAEEAATAAAFAVATTSAASPAASQSAVGTSPGTWTPLTASLDDDENGKTFDMVAEQVLLIDDSDVDLLPNTALVVTSSDEGVAYAEQAEGSGDVTAVPAVIAVAPGTATITVTVVDVDDAGKPVDGGTTATLITYTVNVK